MYEEDMGGVLDRAAMCRTEFEAECRALVARAIRKGWCTRPGARFEFDAPRGGDTAARTGTELLMQER